MQRTALIAVGTELLRLGREETNTAWIADRMADHGVEVVQRTTVTDDVEAITATTLGALEVADLVVLTGGLGPTDDDRTREALARALGSPLRRDAERLGVLRQRFEEYGFPWSEFQARQADIPDGAEWVDNPRGSAAGICIRSGERTVVALPGVPSEMKPMVRAGLAGWLGAAAAQAAAVATLRVAGCGEGEVDARLSDLYAEPGIDVITLASADGVELHLRAVDRSDKRVEARLRRLRDAMVERLGADLYTEDDRSLAEVVGGLLVDRSEKLATAESCTGGLIGAEITAVPGSSQWFLGGWIVYHDDLKRGWASVPADVLKSDGAVSESVARKIAEAVREQGGADWGIGVTGIAGPAGGTPEKPVGLVHVALASNRGTLHWKTRQPGDRAWVRRRAAAFALDRLRRALQGAGS